MTAAAQRLVIFRVPGAESATNADRLAATAVRAGLEVLIAPYWPDGQDSAVPQAPLLARDIGSAPRLSGFAFRQAFGFDLDLADLSAHLFATQPITADLLLPESVWSQRLRGVAQTAARFLDEVSADIVFVPHGAEIVSRLLAEMVVASNRRLLFWESGFFPGFLYIDPHAPHFFRGECRMDRLPLPIEASPKARAFIDLWKTNRTSKYLQNSSPLARRDLHAWSSADNRPVIFLPGQIATDANAVVSLGPHQDLGAAYREALQSLPQDWRIIYKPHPLAQQDILQDFEAPADRFFRTDADIHDIFAVSQAVLTYSSNVGLEALLAGLPVALLGRPVYSGRGLTHDLASPEDLGALLAGGVTPPDAAVVSIFLSLVLSEGLAEDNDAAGLSRIIAKACALPQPPRLPWYGVGVQALGRAAQELTAALHPARPLSEAFDALSASSRQTLLQHVSAETFADHIFGGPLAPAAKLAPRPMPEVPTDSALIYSDLKLEESIDPVAALREALGSVAPDTSLCLSLPSEAACPSDTVQRLSRRDLDALCAQCDPPRMAQVLGLDSDHWARPDVAPAWLVLATPADGPQPSPAAVEVCRENPVAFRPWSIPASAFSYRDRPQPSASGVLVWIQQKGVAIYGPYISMPPRAWRVSWRLRQPFWRRMLGAAAIIAMDVVEHRDNASSVIARTTAGASEVSFDAAPDATYEFRAVKLAGARPCSIRFCGVVLTAA